MALPELLIDKRIVERSIQRGKIERAEYDQSLEQLPDSSHNVWRPDAEKDVADAPQEPSSEPRPQSTF